MEYYGQTSNDNATAWIQFDTGDASFNNILGKIYVTATSLPASNNIIYYLTYTDNATSGHQDIKNSSRLYIYEDTTSTYFNVGSSSTSGGITIHNANGNYSNIISSAFSANRTVTLPNADGWLAVGAAAGVGSDIAPVYLNSNGVLTATDGKFARLSGTNQLIGFATTMGASPHSTVIDYANHRITFVTCTDGIFLYDTTASTTIWSWRRNSSNIWQGDITGHASLDLALTGGVLSGNLTCRNSTIDASLANNNVSSTQYPTTFNITDKNDRIMTRLEGVIQSDGIIKGYWYVRNYNTSGTQVAQKGISIAMAKDGTITYGISDDDKFRSAINVLRYINSTDVTTWTADTLAATDSLAFMRGSVTGAHTTGHIVFLNVKTIGTPFQLAVHDSSELYIWKRYWVSGNSAYSAWTKMNAGYADTAGSAESCTGNAATATKLQTARSLWGNSFDGTADISGNIYVSKAGETYVRATNTTTSCSIELNSYTDKQGLWSNGYWNGSAYTAASKWLIYRGTDGNVIVNGDITGNAATATKATNLNCSRVTKSANEHPGKNIVRMQEFSNTSTNTPSAHWYYILESQGDDTAYSTQLALGETTSALYYRAIQNNTYGNWLRIIDNTNWYKYIFANKNISRSTLSVYDSTWTVTSGTDVFGLSFKDTGLTYTPSGGSATASSDTGDWRAWLTCAADSNTVMLNMRIDGSFQANNLISSSTATFGGDLLFTNSATTTRQIRGVVGDNDYWRIAGGATAANAGWMEIATADDGNEPIYVRQYTGTYTSITRTLTLLDASGNSTFPGDINISHAIGDATLTASSKNPRIIFSENGAQPVHIAYTDWDSYRAPAGLKVVGGASASKAWFEIEGNVYFGGDGIYHVGTAATQRIIRIIDSGDQYGTGVSIGAGGLALFGGGESTGTLISSLSLTAAGTETTYISADGSIEFYPGQNSYDASSHISMVNGSIWAGVAGNTTRENQVGVRSGAGAIYMYAQAATGGSRGIYLLAHGTGSAKGIVTVDTNNNATFTGTLSGNCTGNSNTANYQNCTNTNEIRYARNGNMASANDLWQGWAFAEGKVAVINGWRFGNGNGALAPIYGSKIYNAIWNDFAEYRESDVFEGGRVLVSDGHGKLVLATERLQPAARVISDTFGCSVGQSDKAKTPIGVAGRVLVYPYQDRNNYKVGDCLCAAPNGTADIMTREEIINYPDRIIGIVDEIPTYEVWQQSLTNYKKKDNGEIDEIGEKNTTDTKVNGRIWIYVR